MSPVYITGMGTISPQQTFADETLLSPVINSDQDKLTCIEPDYTAWMDLRQLRRMSRILKMGVASGLKALKQAGVVIPDAIITGTGYGCLEDTGVFLSKMIELREEALNPTPFIQSTHNTIGSLIALQLGCQGYNQTYTQGGFSFENSLLDAMLQLQENSLQHILVGGVDEITDFSHTIQKRFGLFKQAKNGEGSAYFVVTGNKPSQPTVAVKGIGTFYKAGEETLQQGVTRLLADANVSLNDVEVILTGGNGKPAHNALLESVAAKFATSVRVDFKPLCGEYPVATAFACWLGSHILQTQAIPSSIVMQKNVKPAIRNVLVINQYAGSHHSFTLLGL